MLTYANGLNQIAKQAHWLEMNGNIRGQIGSGSCWKNTIVALNVGLSSV